MSVMGATSSTSSPKPKNERLIRAFLNDCASPVSLDGFAASETKRSLLGLGSTTTQPSRCLKASAASFRSTVFPTTRTPVMA